MVAAEVCLKRRNIRREIPAGKSLLAKAKNIWINFYWAGENSAIAIVDDGRGMEENKLREPRLQA